MVNINYRVTSMGLTEVFHTEFLHWLGNFCVEFVIVTSKGPQEPRRILSTKYCNKPQYDLILGVKTMKKCGIISDFKNKMITIDEVKLPMRNINYL